MKRSERGRSRKAVVHTLVWLSGRAHGWRGSDQQSTEQILKGTGIVTRCEWKQAHIFNWDLHVVAGLDYAPRHSFDDLCRTHEPDALHYGRSLIYRRIRFVVTRLRKVRGGDSGRADDAGQQEQNECPKAASH